MATIIEPTGGWASHDEIFEHYQPGAGDGTQVTMDFEFGYDLLPTETFKSLTITASPDVSGYGVSIQGARVSGYIADYFERQGANLELTIRDRKTLAITQVNGFNNLPTAGVADVIKFNPPREQQDQITYTVTLEAVDNTDPMLPVPVVVTQAYTQTIRGSYSAWAGKLQQYIRSCGPFA